MSGPRGHVLAVFEHVAKVAKILRVAGDHPRPYGAAGRFTEKRRGAGGHPFNGFRTTFYLFNEDAGCKVFWHGSGSLFLWFRVVV